MCNDYFGLNRSPFTMAPDPDFLYLTPQHREALVGMSHAVVNRKGFAVLTGDAGTGKTTLLARMLRSMPSNRIRSSIVFHPTLSPHEFLEAAMLDFGITDFPSGKARLLWRFQQFLADAHSQGLTCALI